MSIISNVSNVLNYVSGETKPLSGQQLIIAHYKTDKKTGIKPNSKSVSIPKVTKEAIKESIDGLIPAIETLLYNSQVEVFKELLSSKDNLTEVEQSKLDLPAIITFLNETAKSERISKDSISAWFDEIGSSYLSVAIAEKLGITAETAESSEKFTILASTLDSYKENFAKLAAISVGLSSDTINALVKALSFIKSDDNDNVRKYLSNKLDKIINAPKADLLAL